MAEILVVMLFLGLCTMLIVLVMQLLAPLLLIVLAAAHAQFSKTAIEALGEDARRAIDQASQDYVDQILASQLGKEKRNEPFR